jgi:hypothetical protein
MRRHAKREAKRGKGRAKKAGGRSGMKAKTVGAIMTPTVAFAE